MAEIEQHASRVADLISDAGGQVIGKTRLQKIAFLLEAAGLGAGYKFAYHYYGPYSSALDSECKLAWAFDEIEQVDRQASWGGTYSIFSVKMKSAECGPRQKLAIIAASTDAIVLELAATAAFLKKEGYDDPWEETRNRKPDKTTPARVEAAKSMYRKLMKLDTPNKLPDIL